MIEVTLQDFKEWAFHPCTEKFVKQLSEDRTLIADSLAGGKYQDFTEMKRIIGKCQAIADVLNTIQEFKLLEEQNV